MAKNKDKSDKVSNKAALKAGEAKAGSSSSAKLKVGSQANGQPKSPIFRVVGQYIKDLSFENPNAPQIFTVKDSEPKVEIEVSVNVETLDANAGMYECDLKLNLSAKTEKNNYFLVEVSYGGVFNVLNIPEKFLQQTLYVECPRYVFPYVRQIITNVTQNGGYPPVNLAPIDFLALYQQNMAQKVAADQSKGETKQ